MSTLAGGASGALVQRLQLGLRRAGETWWAYPGCPEGRGFDETGEKGALLVTLDSSGAEAEFVPLAMRRYEILTADMTGDDPAAMRAAAPWIWKR